MVFQQGIMMTGPDLTSGGSGGCVDVCMYVCMYVWVLWTKMKTMKRQTQLWWI